jgi:NSS family neurotransmitter:Na+ symporter
LGGAGWAFGYSVYSVAGHLPSLSAFTAADVIAAMIAGMVIFPIVFSFGGEPSAGPQLAFDTLPMLSRQFPGIVGAILVTSLYLLLSIAALTSAISLLETVLVALMEGTGVSRRRGLGWLLFALMLLGLPTALSYTAMKLTLFGSPVLDVLDTVTGMVLLPFGVILTAIVLGWLAPAHLMERELPPGFIGRSCLFLVRFAVPAAILTVLVTTIVQHLRIQ